MTQRDERVLVTLAEIARFAGVGRAAVSNWRRRFDDFPAPVGGSDASPQFALDTVEEWLLARGKLRTPSRALDRLWPHIEALGDRDRMGLVIAEAGLRLASASVPPPWPTGMPELSVDELHLVDEAVRARLVIGGGEVFAFLLERWLSAHVRQIATTSVPLAGLMTALADEVHEGGSARYVVDPACGTGTLLLAAARKWSGQEAVRLAGFDSDAVLGRLAAARLSLATGFTEGDVAVADTLRDDPHAGVRANVVLCNLPANERHWGHDELATDRRWLFGQPPRTESELAWVQHIVSRLAEDGVAVVLLPPAVASRRAGRRIRAGLLRAGSLQAVVALPPGAAPPYGVGLHLWVLRPPRAYTDATGVLLIDAADCRHTTTEGGSQVVDWDAVQDRVIAGWRGEAPPGAVTVPLVDLLGEETDLTPARHVPPAAVASAVELGRSWDRFDSALAAVRDAGRVVRSVTPAHELQGRIAVTVGELEAARAIRLTPGGPLPEAALRRGPRPDHGVPVCMAARMGEGQGEQWWLAADDVERGEQERELTVTAFGDVVVVATFAEFDAWVETSAATVLGPHVHRLRVDPERLDPWFLAACLRVRFNARQAGTHASVSSRVDVRRLRALRLPIDEQRHYGAFHRRLLEFEQASADLALAGGELSGSLSELLAVGQLAVG
ncbi:N-6 DNA methylase [Streptomyces sp. UNOC14_S4]|uniref:N-6 DNA methylase n=1 Tax=Streptomyces sp. UNOC14_S4 TaxID=2872340 RepID=UPI001E55E77F|nr:N-6 DNA methylase [Streptomyces sp. UNOC14_S4]MCC3766825.1 N-6 DNA methylase [Streptomyces sp. UNOC14_S4]